MTSRRQAADESITVRNLCRIACAERRPAQLSPTLHRPIELRGARRLDDLSTLMAGRPQLDHAHRVGDKELDGQRSHYMQQVGFHARPVRGGIFALLTPGSGRA